VEHPCNRCGAAVDNNSPFCPTCEAPQIRFVPREAAEDAVRLHPATAPPTPVVVPAPDPEPYRTAAAASERRRWLRAAIYAAAIGALLSTIRFGVLIGMPLVGILAVRFYRSGAFVRSISPQQGFRLGALSGFLSFTMLAFVSAITVLGSGGRAGVRNRMLEVVRQYQAANPDPQAQQLLQYFQTTQGMAVMVIGGMLFMCVVFVVIAGLTGMISASIASRNSPR
jgi:hypothetical protein